MMTLLHKLFPRSCSRLHKWQRALLSSVAVALITACGPGTGGTGSGDGALPHGSSSIGVSVFLGNWVTSASSVSVNMDVSAQSVHVSSSCWSFDYQGSLAQDSLGNLSVSGTYTLLQNGGASQSTAARLLAAYQAPDLQVTLTDASGAMLQGPLSLAPSSSGPGPTPAACGGH